VADGVEGWEVWLSGTEREREEILAGIALAFYSSGLDGCLHCKRRIQENSTPRW